MGHCENCGRTMERPGGWCDECVEPFEKAERLDELLALCRRIVASFEPYSSAWMVRDPEAVDPATLYEQLVELVGEDADEET